MCAESENNEKEIYIRNVDERENAEMSLRRGERPYSCFKYAHVLYG